MAAAMIRFHVMNAATDNPCLACGACCMSYRVSFYWAEAGQRGLPGVLTEQLNPFMSCMAGTNCKQPHCAALQQSADGAFLCRVYAQRPDPCREVQIGDDKCLQARARHGLPPLQLFGP
jgi:Fe-S-cluster containining protein